MSLQELRGTLFDYLSPRIGPALGSEEGEPLPIYLGIETSPFRDLSPDFDDRDNESSKNLALVLGGKRKSTCEIPIYNSTGYMIHSSSKVSPAFEFELKGEDPTFLGGWLSDDSPFGQHYNSIISERDGFKVDLDGFKAENAELEAAK